MIKLLLSWWARIHHQDIYWWRDRAYYSRSFKEGESIQMSTSDHQRLWAQRIERKVNGK